MTGLLRPYVIHVSSYLTSPLFPSYTYHVIHLSSYSYICLLIPLYMCVLIPDIKQPVTLVEDQQTYLPF